MKLNEAMQIILYEWNIQNKKEISKGVGSSKKVFPYHADPNYVIKQFTKFLYKDKAKEKLEAEYNFYKEYPDLFAKIIKINYDRMYMVQEKLNTKMFLSSLYTVVATIKNYLKKNFPKVQTPNENDELEFFWEYVNNSEFPSISKIFADKKSFANKLFIFLKKLEAADGLDDLGKFNVGMDKKGNIKLLDL